jgi:hypothetical protein
MFKLYAAGKYVGMMSKAACQIWLTENYKLNATKIETLFNDGEVYKGATYFQIKNR